MLCINTGTKISDTGKRRTYYLLLNHDVGACSGEFTRYVFAEWHVSGAIHGRPISLAALQRMGITA
jgi:hypothetical protein